MNLNERSGGISSRDMLDPPETLLLTPEAYKATEAVEFIAEHLRNEDEYTQVSFGLFVQFRGILPSYAVEEVRGMVGSCYNFWPFSDSRGLEVRGHGHRSFAVVRVFRRNDRWHYWHSHQRAAHLRIRRPG